MKKFQIMFLVLAVISIQVVAASEIVAEIGDGVENAKLVIIGGSTGSPISTKLLFSGHKDDNNDHAGFGFYYEDKPFDADIFYIGNMNGDANATPLATLQIRTVRNSAEAKFNPSVQIADFNSLNTFANIAKSSIGVPFGTNGMVAFSHRDKFKLTDYALAQEDNGDVNINTPVAGKISFKVGNFEKAFMDQYGAWTLSGLTANNVLATGYMSATDLTVHGNLFAMNAYIPTLLTVGSNERINNGGLALGVSSPLITGAITVPNGIVLGETVSAPAVTANYGKLYVNAADSQLYFKDDLGMAQKLSFGNSSSINIGARSLAKNTSGYENSAIGYESLANNTTGFYNTAIGRSPLYANTTGNRNDAFGYASLYANTTGAFNTAFGFTSLYSNTTGNYNVAFGNAALRTNKQGIGSTALGYQALYTSNGDYNTALGYLAGSQITQGANNITIGKFAGNNITTGSNNIIIGSAGSSSPTASNYLNIGNLIIGDMSTKKLGVNVTDPARTLDIKDVMRVRPTATPPTGAAMGDIYMDSSGVLCVFNGASWDKIGAGQAQASCS